MADLEVNVGFAGANSEVSVIGARGYIDTVTAPELEKRLQELMGKKVYKIIVNLKDVSYISSAGWGIFVSELRDIRENGGDLILVEMTPDVYDVYELMEFSSILKSFDGMDDAFRNFGISAAAAGKAPAAVAAAGAAGGGQFSGLPTGDKVKQIIRENPYFDEKQIRAELATDKYGAEKIGFFEIKKVLRDLGLDDGKKRYEFAAKK